jgi:hypothetical protein
MRWLFAAGSSRIFEDSVLLPFFSHRRQWVWIEIEGAMGAQAG